MLSILLGSLNPISNYPKMPDFSVIVNIACGLRFVSPTDFAKPKWVKTDSEIRDMTESIHFRLSNDVLTPDVASEPYTSALCDYSIIRPEFTPPKSKSKGYIQLVPKTICEAKALKSKLHKQVQKGYGNKEDRRHFAESIRYHNYLLKHKPT